MEVTDIPRENRNALGKNAPIEKKRASSSLGYHEKPHQKVKHLKNNASVSSNLPSSLNLQNKNIAMPIVVKDGSTQSKDPAKKSRRHQKSKK